MEKISIIIPVFNEQDFIDETLKRVCLANSLGLKKEVIIIDDGSIDKTRPTVELSIKKLNTKFHDIKFKTIFEKINSGKGSAIKKGFLSSTGDIILIQDADLEYNPDDYPILLEPFLKNNADVVYGSRFISNRPHRVLYFWHYQINLFLTLFSNMLTNLNLTDMETGFKVFKKSVVKEVAPKLESRRFGFEPEITARISKIKGLKIFEVGISYSGRTYEEGKKIGWIDGVKAIWEIFKFNLLSN